MVFEATAHGRRFISIYESVGRFVIEENEAFAIGDDGGRTPVSVSYVLALLQHHKRHYKHAAELTQRRYNIGIGTALIVASIVATFFFFPLIF